MPRSKTASVGFHACRGTSLIRNRHPVGPCSRTMPRLLCHSSGCARCGAGAGCLAIEKQSLSLLGFYGGRRGGGGSRERGIPVAAVLIVRKVPLHLEREYMGTSLTRNTPSEGPYASGPRAILEGGAVSCERSTPVRWTHSSMPWLEHLSGRCRANLEQISLSRPQSWRWLEPFQCKRLETPSSCSLFARKRYRGTLPV